jgi:predicted AlkP superfamily phosphohydrolase/phosphomutase
MEGREPDGAVPEAEYEAVRDDLIADLEALTGPDGRQVCRKIVRGEDAFSGDETAIAPDLVVIPADGYDLKAGFTDKDEVFATGPRNGMHKFENACLFSTSADMDLTEVDLLDIAPTILDLMDIDANTDRLDGASLIA